MDDTAQFRVPLACTSAGQGGPCSLPHGYIMQDGRLSVTSRHHGEKHTYITTVTQLLRLMLAYKLIGDDTLVLLRDMVDEALTPAKA
jgi:hypothetical protein